MEDFVRYGVAAIWIVMGFGFKVLNWVPRHRAIVAHIMGERFAAPLTIAIGWGETAIGVWMASGYRAVTCVALQTVLVVVMNALELGRVRELLLFPGRMLLLNATWLTLAWWAVL